MREVPVPTDDDLMVEDVVFVHGAEPDVPRGWIYVDGCYEVTDEWMVQVLRKTGASEKQMTADERALMMEAKMKELEWTFAEVNPGDESRIVSSRWVLTWKDGGDWF